MTELDPVLAHIAAGAAAAPGPFEGTPDEARARLAAAITSAPDTASRDSVARIEERTVWADGHEVPTRIIWPRTETPSAIVVFLHGGGYVLGSAELSDDITCRLAVELQAVVVAPEYRLAPENPFPAALDDATCVIRWAATGLEGTVPADTPLVLVGESAGANIGASAALNAGAALAAQVLVVPGPDFAALRYIHDDVPGALLRVADMEDIVRLAFGDWEAAGRFPASAAASTTLSDAPPTVVAIAGYDPTAPVGRTFADLLATNGVDVTVLELDDVFHPFLGFAHISPAAAQAFSAICEATRALVSRHSTPHSSASTP